MLPARFPATIQSPGRTGSRLDASTIRGRSEDPRLFEARSRGARLEGMGRLAGTARRKRRVARISQGGEREITILPRPFTPGGRVVAL